MSVRRLAESGLVVDTGERTRGGRGRMVQLPDAPFLGAGMGCAIVSDGAVRHVPVRAATVTVEPSLTGARTAALRDLRTAIIAGR